MTNKHQGLVVSTALAVALLVRPAGSLSPQEPSSSDSDRTGTSSSPHTEPWEGPWIASCNYWAPARDPKEQSPEKTPEVSGAIGDRRLELYLDVEETKRKQELGCSAERKERWGFPKHGGPIQVTAIIAAVPDPVHTHLALTFDRSVEAILQAAADNEYVSSYYWLPWKNRGGVLKAAESRWDVEPGHDPERERQPGLIVLEHVPAGSEASDSSVSFRQVIYLFLVGEAPTKGIDGFQLQNAFLYETELKSAIGDQFSTGAGNRLAMVGPTYSGSVASLSAAIERARSKSILAASEFDVAGATATRLSVTQLKSQLKLHYLSFADDRTYDMSAFLHRLSGSGYDGEFAFLVEDNTAFGNGMSGADSLKDGGALVIRFPREISLLRNARAGRDQSANSAAPPGIAYSPYLHFSLKDYSAQDSVPIFSPENTPLSQEAQLMTIARQLHRYRSKFIAIAASNVLDQIFLSQFLHRACPDATLLFFAADLLSVRAIDNVPFIGAITITPYPMIGLGRGKPVPGKLSAPLRTYTNSSSYAYYNATSYTFWRANPGSRKQPILQGYHSLLEPDDLQQPSLWATAIGSDGYYPLAILSPCSSSQNQVLPAIDKDGNEGSQTCAAHNTTDRGAIIYPSRLWDVLCVLIFLLCLFHTAMLGVADYWSPFTRDLAIRDNDQPRRRSMYVHAATAMLFSMAFVVSFPVLWLDWKVGGNLLSVVVSMATLCGGVLAVCAAISKTRGHIGWAASPASFSDCHPGIRHLYGRVCRNVYFFLNLFVITALFAICSLWSYACCTGSFLSSPDLVGLSFCFRCINPGSGVSPLVPVLLLLFSWYIWGLLQTWRLRFSMNGRPWLPGKLNDQARDRFFVSDDDLAQCRNSRDSCLYNNITCLLITRQLLCRFSRFRRAARPDELSPRDGAGLDDCLGIDILLMVAYPVAMVLFFFFIPIRGMDHFLWKTGPHLPSPYEFLVAALFFPIIGLSLAGWLRMILIWGALKTGLLDRLENLPVRFAFGRLKGTGWMTMLRQGGLQEHWRDMGRSLESMRQMLHQPDFQLCSDRLRLQTAYEDLLAETGKLRLRIAAPADQIKTEEFDYDFVRRMEIRFAAFSRDLLSTLLIPYWKDERTGLVEGKEVEPHAGPASVEPARILVAEEFLVIRYISLIRAVLANLRYLMTFVSISFVLAILAWNSYPFQPRQVLDWVFTGLLAFLGSGVIWVFAQMHRNPILSRITDTKANELGWEFYLRVISFGALPVLTWVTYQFPDIGSVIYRFIQPGVPVIK
ncbi:MAG: hypothetical protein ABSG03_03000 [Bryobacteraceae bacterium]